MIKLQILYHTIMGKFWFYVYANSRFGKWNLVGHKLVIETLEGK